ncbi:hypothetical protein GCM10007049_22340 [Echinicola pacifica]|uniref:Transcription elongation factor, GreA/GreB, C-term n=1 Tax=Echinicola pacifica TaxID=346377 RepID=A0A918URE5_9BACT|nr:hypothetical protein [Echinicola pacifica]GGZ28828.1 hypothetical protein GCM10007049_22340 [Echinicola pacifica]
MNITKQALISEVRDYLNSKKAELEASLVELKQSAASDTKSSAGDKYETGREMVRQEMDKATNVLAEYNKQSQILSGIDPNSVHEKVQVGSLVITDKAFLFIAAAIGQLKINGQVVFVISPHAPLAQSMLGKSLGDRINFGQISHKITALY